jgi:RNA polymerase sigma-70 factor (ECF subfamily)
MTADKELEALRRHGFGVAYLMLGSVSEADVLRSARSRRESYVGPWLPEPLLEDPAPDPAMRAELADSLSMALLVLLERLSPLERAAYLLREVFDYGYAEIAGIIEQTEVNSRQLVSRARARTGRSRCPRASPSRCAIQASSGIAARSRTSRQRCASIATLYRSRVPRASTPSRWSSPPR